MEPANDELLGTLAEELERISTIPKCEGCKCCVDTVQEFCSVAKKQSVNGLISTRHWLEKCCHEKKCLNDCVTSSSSPKS